MVRVHYVALFRSSAEVDRDRQARYLRMQISKMTLRRLAFCATLSTLVSILILAFAQTASAQRSSTIIHVKFRAGTDVNSPHSLLPPELKNAVTSINKLFGGVPSSKLDEMKTRGESRSRQTLPDMNLWFR